MRLISVNFNLLQRNPQLLPDTKLHALLGSDRELELTKRAVFFLNVAASWTHVTLLDVCYQVIGMFYGQFCFQMT